MSIHARFRLDQVNRSRGFYKAPGEEQAKPVEAAYVYLYGVQGEPFGNATPSAKQELLIVNPEAANQFLHAPIGTEIDVVYTLREAPKVDAH